MKRKVDEDRYKERRENKRKGKKIKKEKESLTMPLLCMDKSRY